MVSAAEALASFEGAAAHLEKQLRRYKSRLKRHHSSRKEPVRQETAAYFTIAPAAEEEPADGADLNPAIIAESLHTVAELSVGEAVMQLDISTMPFVLFRNARDGGLNVSIAGRTATSDGSIPLRPSSPETADRHRKGQS